MHSIFTIVKKELKRSFTDARVLLGMLLPGLIIFLMYSLMGNIFTSFEEKSTSYKNFTVKVVNMPEDTTFKNYLDSYFKEKEFVMSDIYTDVEETTTITIDEFKEKITNKEADLLVIYPENFIEIANARIGDETKPTPNIEIYYNSSRDESSCIFDEYNICLQMYETAKCNMFDVNRAEEGTSYNLANKDDASKKFLSMMLPFLLIIFLFSGAMSFCADSFAGEKERGTMATLLMTPTKRSHIAIGKIIALSIMALVSATASFIGIIFSLPKMLGSASSEFNFNVYGFGTYVLLFLVIISITLLFIAILGTLSAFAKSVREASSLCIPVMILVMLIGITGFMSTGAQTNAIYYLIPVYNAVQSLTAILSGNINSLCLGITIIANIIYVVVIVIILARMLNSERIMFKK